MMADSKRPVYLQLSDSIVEKIRSGEYHIGEKIMSERKMAEAYGLNRLTVRKAVNNLISKGFLSAAQGKGTYVSSIPHETKKVQFGQNENVSLSATLRQSGFQSSRIVLSFKLKKADETLRGFFDNSPKVYELIRLSKIDGEPYAIQISTFPATLFKEPERFDFGDGSLYTYMDSQGHMPTTILSEMKAIIIPKQYQEIMDYPGEKLVFYYEYSGYDANHKMVEFTKAYYKPEYTSFKFKTKR